MSEIILNEFPISLYCGFEIATFTNEGGSISINKFEIFNEMNI